MARIAGVDLPHKKRMEIALTYIYGIGRSGAHKICTEAGVEPAWPVITTSGPKSRTARKIWAVVR